MAEQLDTTVKDAAQLDKIREAQRENLAYRKRLQEVEYLLEQSERDKQDYSTQLKAKKEEINAMGLQLLQTEEKCL